MNTIEIDVKDENGEIGFVPSSVPLARTVGAAKAYYKPREAARLAHRKGVYLIGRVVMFEDPLLSAGSAGACDQESGRIGLAKRAGLGWTNPYDKRVWDYNVWIAEVAARAGFDEIQFDYVRFPTDGNVDSTSSIPRKTATPPGWVIAEFVHYAAKRLRPLGVRVSTDLFGLAATRDLGIGQVPQPDREVRRRDLPDGLPVPFRPGRVRARGSERVPRGDGRVGARPLPPRAEAGQGGADPVAAGLLVRPDVRALGREGADRRGPPDGRARLLLWNPLGIYTPGALAPGLRERVTLRTSMAIGDVMRTRVVTVRPTTPCGSPCCACSRKASARSRSATEAALVGIFTERDVLGLVGESTDLDDVSGRRDDA